MSIVSWLHISDLHILCSDPKWRNYRGSLLEACKNNGSEEMERKPDFVVVTGDYRNVRVNEQFEEAEKFIRELMETLGLDLDRDLFLVPGNHDLKPKCGDTDPRIKELQKLLPANLTPWSASAKELVPMDLVTKKREKQFAQWLEDVLVPVFEVGLPGKHKTDPENYLDRLCGIERNTEEDHNIVKIPVLYQGFEEYCSAAKRLISWYSKENQDPAAVHCRTWKNSAGVELNLVHFNTALVSDGNRLHYQALDLREAQEVLGKITNGLPTLILAHNDFYDLHPKIQAELIPALNAANTCAWLCGDIHRFHENRLNDEIPRGTDRAADRTIPIFVCGKGAPDNMDTYSEHGVIYYKGDGEQIEAQYLKWEPGGAKKLTPAGKRAFPFHIPTPGKYDGILQNAGDLSEDRKKLFVGYLSCDPSKAFQDKYHMGHGFFINTVDKLREKKDNVVILTSSYILKPSRTSEKIEKDKQYAAEMIQLWMKCFQGQNIEIIDITEKLWKNYSRTIPGGKLLDYVTTMEEKLCDGCEIAEKWFQTGELEDDTYLDILDILKVGHADIKKYTKDEIMSFAYLLHRRPVWYNSTWLVHFIEFWHNDLLGIANSKLKAKVEQNDIFIIEARRNHYVWDAISYCAKRFSFTNFPRVKYFENFLDTKCENPMKSSNEDKTVFLKDHNSDKEYSEEFRKHVCTMFHTERDPNEVAEEYFKRMGL